MFVYNFERALPATVDNIILNLFQFDLCIYAMSYSWAYLKMEQIKLE